jgi:hypothetical protein
MEGPHRQKWWFANGAATRVNDTARAACMDLATLRRMFDLAQEWGAVTSILLEPSR